MSFQPEGEMTFFFRIYFLTGPPVRGENKFFAGYASYAR
jgi:hypothetical protein